MLDATRGSSSAEEEYVQFHNAGTRAIGQFHCAGCGYGITIHADLPTCPMCGGDDWEEAAWSPLSRALEPH
jgi:hypothetical protein